MMMTILLYAGVLLLVIGAIAALCILNYILSEVNWHAKWNWGNARQLKRSVKLGWNTGVPPEGKKILVRGNIWMHSFDSKYNDTSWAVMTVSRGRCYTPRGSSMPVKNITGWLEIVEDKRS